MGQAGRESVCTAVRMPKKQERGEKQLRQETEEDREVYAQPGYLREFP